MSINAPAMSGYMRMCILLCSIICCCVLSVTGDDNKIVAFVGCRKGSRRLTNKNTLPFFGEKTLIDIKLKQLLKTPEVDMVVFSSNDPLALQIAR